MPKRDFNAESTGTADISSDSLCTPKEIIHPLWRFWGQKPDTDPCSNEHSIVKAKVTYTFGGLHRPWHGKTWQNHPYSTNEPWIDKAVHEMRIGNVTELVILCMSATSTLWWKKAMVVPKRNPRVIMTRRLCFLGPGGVPMPSGARFDTALIYYGAKHKKFDRAYAHVARWSTWGR